MHSVRNYSLVGLSNEQVSNQNGQLKDSGELAECSALEGDRFVMLGVQNAECGYAWDEGDALHLLGEALFALAQCVGPEGRDTKGRSYTELLEEARQAAEEALALRKEIQDPKVSEAEDLLGRLRREHKSRG